MKNTIAILAVAVLSAAVANAAPDEAYKADLKKANEIGALHVHSGGIVAAKRIAAAEEFIAKYAGDESKANDVNRLRERIINASGRYLRRLDGTMHHAAALAKCKEFGFRLRGLTALASDRMDKARDFEGALGLLEPLYAEKSLRIEEYGRLVQAGADILVAKDDRDAALAYVEKARTRFPGTLDGKRETQQALDARLDGVSAGVYAAFFDYRGVVDWWLKRGNRSAALRPFIEGNIGGTDAEWAEGTKLARELVAEERNLDAWAYLWLRDAAACEAAFDALLAERKGAVKAKIERMFGGSWGCSEFGEARVSEFHYNAESAIRLYRLYLKAVAADPKASAAFAPVRTAAIAYASVGDRAAASAALAEGLKAPKLSAAEAYQLKLMAFVIGLKGGEDEIYAKVKAFDAPLAKEAFPEGKAKERRKSLGAALSIASAAFDETLARGLARYCRETVQPEPPKKRYTVRFSERPLTVEGGWKGLSVDPAEDPFDRQYGGAGLAFMTTDVATGDRGEAAEGGEKARKYPTTLKVVADEWGVHFLFTYYDKRARLFESGELDAGSYECYLAPGELEPYACFLFRAKKDAVAGVMNTSYPADGHCRINPRDRSSMRHETYFTDDAVCCYTAFSWDNYSEHIPVKGAEWDFESIFWGPVQSAWNGTASIHGRSTFGKLVFDLDEAARVKILRAQLIRAVGAYRAEKTVPGSSAAGIQGGSIEHWSDDVLGDPEFYAAKVAPLVAELDAVAAKVSLSMSDADVKEISERYLSTFVNIRRVVARLRTAWTAERLTAAGR